MSPFTQIVPVWYQECSIVFIPINIKTSIHESNERSCVLVKCVVVKALLFTFYVNDGPQTQ